MLGRGAMPIERRDERVGKGLYRRALKGGGYTYRMRYRDPETSKQVSTDLGPDRRAAEMMQRQVLADLDKHRLGLGDMVRQRVGVAHLTGLFLEAQRPPRVSQEHYRDQRQSLKAIKGALSVESVSDLRGHHIEHLSRLWQAKGNASTTIRKKVAHFRTMLRWAVDVGHIARDPLANFRLKIPKQEARRRRAILSPEQLAAMIDAAREDDQRWQPGARIPQAPALSVMIFTAFRANEALTLEWQDLIDDPGPCLRVRKENAKTGTERRNPIPRELYAELVQLRAGHARKNGRMPGPTDRILLAPRGQPFRDYKSGRMLDWVRRIGELAGVPSTFPDGSRLDRYALRHSVATNMAMEGVQLDVVANILGHSRVETTRKHYQRTDMAVEPNSPVHPFDDPGRAQLRPLCGAQRGVVSELVDVVDAGLPGILSHDRSAAWMRTYVACYLCLAHAAAIDSELQSRPEGVVKRRREQIHQIPLFQKPNRFPNA